MTIVIAAIITSITAFLTLFAAFTVKATEPLIRDTLIGWSAGISFYAFLIAVSLASHISAAMVIVIVTLYVGSCCYATRRGIRKEYDEVKHHLLTSFKKS